MTRKGDKIFTDCKWRKSQKVFVQRWYQFSSITQLCLTLWEPMDCNISDFPVHHQLPDFAQTHVSHVGDAIQPSHSQSSPSHISLNRKSKRIDKLLKLIINFSKVSECKVNMKMPITFLHYDYELVSFDINNTISFILSPILSKYV